MGGRRPRVDPEDDGRTIADMNIDGMPWTMRRSFARSEEPSGQRTPMTKEELRAYTWAAVKAGLLIVLIFGVCFGLFIAFCDFVWFA